MVLASQELRKDGFDLAEARYTELKPILDEVGPWFCVSEFIQGSSRKGHKYTLNLFPNLRYSVYAVAGYIRGRAEG